MPLFDAIKWDWLPNVRQFTKQLQCILGCDTALILSKLLEINWKTIDRNIITVSYIHKLTAGKSNDGLMTQCIYIILRLASLVALVSTCFPFYLRPQYSVAVVGLASHQ